MAGKAYILEGRPPTRQAAIWARPTLNIRAADGSVRRVECIEIKEGNLIRAFLPPRQGGASLTLCSAAGPDAVYTVFDWDWRIVQVSD